MKKEVVHHLVAYSVLGLLLITFVTLYFLYWPDRVMLRGITIGLMISYVLWGVFTHTKTSHLTGKLVLEYVAVALLSGAMLLTLTW